MTSRRLDSALESAAYAAAAAIRVGLALLALAWLTGSANAAPKAPTYGTFTDAQKEAARLQNVVLDEHAAHREELPLSAEERAMEEQAAGLRASDDNDATHYCRGRTLVINLFINHAGGTWSTTEKEDKAARNSVAKDYYIDNAPANANVHFDLEGTNGYWEYTATVPNNITADTTFTYAIIDDAIANVGFADADGDGVRIDDITYWLKNWNGGWDNVILQAQPADLTGRATASYAYAYTKIYTDDPASTRAHEWGHIFGSCDEYVEGGECNGGINCGACQSTYLTSTINNGNCQLVSCPTDVSCLMINNTFSGICPYTLEHWGWVDDDVNGQLDLVKRRVSGATFANVYELWNGGWFLWNSTSHGMVYNQTTSTWGVCGVRSPATADYDIRLYGENDHRYLYASSTFGGQAIDFVVGDYNHSPISNDHVQIDRFSGAADDYRLQYESGSGMLFPDGVARAGSWTSSSVVRVWDVPLFAGESMTFVLDVTSGTTDFGMSLFRSSSGPYWAGRSSAQWTRDAGGNGATESWTYTVPADDVYGLVIFANNPADADFTIKIGPTPAALSEEVPFASALDVRLFNYDPNAVYWSVVGNRPTSGDNTTVRLFNDSTYQTELETSNNYNGPSPNNVDFIAVDYNHASGAVDYPRVILNSGTGVHRTEWEHDADIVTGIMPTEAWAAGHVVKVWDANLTGNVPYMLRSYSGTIDQGLYFFSSTDADYYKRRSTFAAGANFRPASEGEWVSFTPTVTDWYGVVQVVNDEGSGSYANWLGRQTTLSNDLATGYSDQVQWGTSTANTPYWHVWGVRPAFGETAGISLYGDGGYTINTLKASDQGAGAVNFVVGDYNHTPAETVYPRVWRSTGTGVVRAEMEAGSETLTYLGGAPVSTSQTWTVGDVVEVFDVFLPAGQNIHVQLNHTSGNLDLGMALFKSNGATYYASPVSAVDQADANLLGGSEGFDYFSAAADWYGLVVYCKGELGGTYELIVGGSSSTDAAVVTGAAEFDLAASPNPFRDDSEIRFSVPREDRVSLDVYDAAGRLVRQLVNGAVPAGNHHERWDGRDTNGNRVTAGVYFARLKTAQEEKVHKLIRVR